MLSANFSKTSKLSKFCDGTFLVMIYVKTDKGGSKSKPHFLIGVAMGLYISEVCLARISYSEQYQL